MYFKALAGFSYAHFPKSCVDGNNIIKYTNRNVDECKELCSRNTKCLAFEYGFTYGGRGNFNPRDCQLQDSAQKENCDGALWNSDLYVKCKSCILLTFRLIHTYDERNYLMT